MWVISPPASTVTLSSASPDSLLVTTPVIYAIPPLKTTNVSGLDGASCITTILPDCTPPSIGAKVAVNSVAVSANTVLFAKTAEKAALSLTTLLIVKAAVPMFAITIVMLADVVG